MCDSVSAVEAVLVKELLWPHFCFITPNLPLNTHTRVCEVTYGVMVRCQWAFTHTALTWKDSMEHSKPLMASNGEWHQSCHVLSNLSLFLIHFSLSFSVTPFLSLSWIELSYMWTQVKTSTSLGLHADRFCGMERVWGVEGLCSVPASCLLSSLGGKRMKIERRQRRRAISATSAPLQVREKYYYHNMYLTTLVTNFLAYSDC